MTFSYKRLWKLLIDKELSKKELSELAGISQYTVNKLNKGESVTTETLSKICDALQYLHNQRLGKLTNFKGSSDFLIYLLCTDTYHNEIISSASGTRVQ